MIQINDTFRNTLDLIPNGVLIVDRASSKVSFANADIISQANGGGEVHIGNIHEKIEEYMRHDGDTTSQSNSMGSMNEIPTNLISDSTIKKKNLWESLLAI